MRITLDLADDIVREATLIAARSGRTVAVVVGEAVRESFGRRRLAVSLRGPLLPPSFGEGGLCPGVDLDDSAALLDAMDGTIR